jgi:predicted transport protein
MPTFSIKGNDLVEITEKKFDLEREIQSLTEKNLEAIFGLKFVSGSLNQEFNVRVLEQDFYIDTLAFDEASQCFIIIEYKKDRSFSVIDQGFAYLSAMLNHKADFILELNERLHKNYTRKDINWDQSRVIFVSPEFTNYQKNAINFKDLPIFLYKVKLFSNNTIVYNPIKPYTTSESIGKHMKGTVSKTVLEEVKVYSAEDLVKPNWTDTKELLNDFENQLIPQRGDVRIKYTQKYIAYIVTKGKNFVEIVPQQKGLKIYFRFPFDQIKSTLTLQDCSQIGRNPNGISFTEISESSQIPEAVRLASESYKYINRA